MRIGVCVPVSSSAYSNKAYCGNVAREGGQLLVEDISAGETWGRGQSSGYRRAGIEGTRMPKCLTNVFARDAGNSRRLNRDRFPAAGALIHRDVPQTMRRRLHVARSANFGRKRQSIKFI